MKHLGDITQINGALIDLVDVITAGSPCQDLSVAGKRAGLEGERSGLFMEFVRIVRQMREATDGACPRYAVWENVPGAFSSNKGDDFLAVLEELCKIKDPTISIPRPPLQGKQHKWRNAGCILGDGWSLAWRVLDAQFWGVPQRRRRIALVMDFRGQSAPEVLFKPESKRGDFAPSREARERTAAIAETGVGSAVYPINTQVITRHKSLGRGTGFGLGDADDPAYTLQAGHEHGVFAPTYAVRMREGCAGGGKGPLIQEEKSGTLATGNDQTVFCLQGNTVDRNAQQNGSGIAQDASFTLNSVDRHAVAFEQKRFGEYAQGIGTLTAQCARASVTGGTLIANEQPTIRLNDQGGSVMSVTEDVTATLRAQEHGHQPCVAVHPDVTGTLGSSGAGLNRPAGMASEIDLCVAGQCRVRRLTPLECERLQGFPFVIRGRCSEMTKDEYIAWNLTVGNILVEPKLGKVFATRGPGGVTLKEPKELAGTDLNGYLVVNIRNGKNKMQCRIHRIVWISQHGIIPQGLVVDHINNDKKDNRIENLQLLTPESNSHKAKLDGRYPTGNENPATKLGTEFHDEIFYLYNACDFTYRDLAEIYGVSKSQIAQIIQAHGWTDIPDYTDDKGKTKKVSDSARYKALGNSIALPPWRYVLGGISEHLPAEATLGSLFDGIGGFPLIWEELHGKGSAVWASEIEAFPIAVTKHRFPEIRLSQADLDAQLNALLGVG